MGVEKALVVARNEMDVRLGRQSRGQLCTVDSSERLGICVRVAAISRVLSDSSTAIVDFWTRMSSVAVRLTAEQAVM